MILNINIHLYIVCYSFFSRSIPQKVQLFEEARSLSMQSLSQSVYFPVLNNNASFITNTLWPNRHGMCCGYTLLKTTTQSKRKAKWALTHCLCLSTLFKLQHYSIWNIGRVYLRECNCALYKRRISGSLMRKTHKLIVGYSNSTTIILSVSITMLMISIVLQLHDNRDIHICESQQPDQ